LPHGGSVGRWRTLHAARQLWVPYPWRFRQRVGPLFFLCLFASLLLCLFFSLGGGVWKSNPPFDPRRAESPALKAGKVTGPHSPPKFARFSDYRVYIRYANPDSAASFSGAPRLANRPKRAPFQFPRLACASAPPPGHATRD